MTPEERADIHTRTGCVNEIHIYGPGGCFECTALMIREAENNALERAANLCDNEHNVNPLDSMPLYLASIIRALKTEAPK